MNEAEAYVFWNCLTEPGDREAGELIASYGVIEAAAKVMEGEVSVERWQPRISGIFPDEVIRRATKLDMKLLLPSAELWPAGLSDLGNFQPTALWYRGNPGNFEHFSRAIGVVGSRVATSYGQRVTAEICEAVVKEHGMVVSGGALGIDAIAHRTTMAVGGVTAAFMAGGIDNPYPAAHHELFEKIAHTGLLLAELPPGLRPTRWRFLQRNRLIAASSEAVVVTEAGWSSGSINTAGHATELTRPVYAVPGPINSPNSAGCNRLIREQQATLLLEANELPIDLGWVSPKIEPTIGMGTLETRLYDVLDHRERHFEDLLIASGLSASELKIAIGGLQLENLLVSGPAGTWKRA